MQIFNYIKLYENDIRIIVFKLLSQSCLPFLKWYSFWIVDEDHSVQTQLCSSYMVYIIEDGLNILIKKI